jgi:hypothetical protein
MQLATQEFVDHEAIQPKKAKKMGLTLTDLERVAKEISKESKDNKYPTNPRLQFSDDNGLGIVCQRQKDTPELQAATALVNLNKKSKKRKREIHVHVHLHE